MSIVPTAAPDNVGRAPVPIVLFRNGHTGELEIGDRRTSSGPAELRDATLRVDGTQIPVFAKVVNPDHWAEREKRMYEELTLARPTNELPHVVECYGVAKLDSAMVFVLEPAACDALNAQATTVQERVELAWSVLVGALRGLVELSAVGLLHRDLHPGNILLMTAHTPGPEDVRITDFNRSSLPEAPPTAEPVHTTNMTYGQTAVMPHDVIRAGGMVQPIDEVFSAAVCAYLMLTRGAEGGPSLPLRNPEQSAPLRYEATAVRSWEHNRNVGLATQIDLSSLDLRGVRTYVTPDGASRGDDLARALSELLVQDRGKRGKALEDLESLLGVRGLQSLAKNQLPSQQYMDVLRDPIPEYVERQSFPTFMAEKEDYRPQPTPAAPQQRWHKRDGMHAVFLMLLLMLFLSLPVAVVATLLSLAPGWLVSAAPEIAAPVSQWSWGHWAVIALVGLAVLALEVATFVTRSRTAVAVAVAVSALVAALTVPVVHVAFWPRPEPAVELADTTMRPVTDCPDGVVTFTRDVRSICWTAPPEWQNTTSSSWVEGTYPFDHEWPDPASRESAFRAWAALTDTKNPCQKVYAIVGQTGNSSGFPADPQFEPHNGQVYAIEANALNEVRTTGEISYRRGVVNRHLLSVEVDPPDTGQTELQVLVQRTACGEDDVAAADAAVSELLGGLEVRDLTQLEAFTAPRFDVGTGRIGVASLTVPIATDLLPRTSDRPIIEPLAAGSIYFTDENSDPLDNSWAMVQVVDTVSVPAEATATVDSRSGQWLTTNVPVAASWATNETEALGTVVDYYRMSVDSSQTPVLLQVRVYTSETRLSPSTLQAFLDRVSLGDPSASEEE